MASRFLKLEKAEESIKLPSCLSHSKKEQHDSSNHEKYFSNNFYVKKVLQKRIEKLLNNHPDGIEIERFSNAYYMENAEYLTPSDYGFKDLIGLLEAFSQIVAIKQKKKITKKYEYSEILLYAKHLSEDDVKVSDVSLKKLPASAKLPSKVLNAFDTILNSHSGGIDINLVSAEYKYYTGEDLDPSCWGFNNIFDMLSNLSDIFTICEVSNGAFILCSASEKEVITKNNEIITNTNEDSLSCSSLNNNDKDARITRKLPLEVQKRLKTLLDNFPNGLEIREIIGAYIGFYGATLDDLNPLEYGYLSLEAFLQAHHDILNVCHYDKNVVVFPFGVMKDVTSPIEFPLPACGAVSSNESYTSYDICKVFKKNTNVDFEIGEVVSPLKFHVIYQGENFSQALNALMDQMYEFYNINREIHKRYEVKKESLLVRTPVVTLYEDQSWYRAIIISIDKINEIIKLFLVDYGTTWSCSYKELRLLHRNFFKLPAQAISASLYGIRRKKGTKHWTKSSATSKFFKYRVQNKYFHSRVYEVSESLIISLWDENNTINDLLVTEGYARYSSENNNNNGSNKINSDINEKEIIEEKIIKCLNNDHTIHADVEQLHHTNEKSSQCSVNLEDGVQNIDLFFRKRKVEQVLISSDQSIHIVYLCGELYIMSSEISRFMWGSDELSKQLKSKGFDVASVVIASDTHADIFTQLLRYGVKDIMDANGDFLPTVTMYTLESVLIILNFFNYKDDATKTIIRNLVWDKWLTNTMF